MSIATAITALQGRVEDAYTALQAKGATIPATKNTYNLPTTIGTITSGGSEAEWKDVNFIDYDGKNLYSYTAQEALNLSELPALPNRSSEGLTCQEWNYTLEQVKANVNSCGKCTVGATYTTTDGKTHLFITIRDQAYRNVSLYFNQSNANGVVVDWGYGSTTSTDQTGNVSLTKSYPDGPYPMTYEIKMSCSSGTYKLGGSGNIFTGNEPSDTTSNIAGRCAILDKVYVGQNMTRFSSNCFNRCRNLKSITIPNNSVWTYGSSFRNCSSLRCVVIPKIFYVNGNNKFDGSGVEVFSVPYSFNFSWFDFNDCKSLREIVLGLNGSISSNVFKGCTSLTKAYNMGLYGDGTNVLDGCNSLSEVVFRDQNNMSIANYALQNCYSLTTLSFPEVVTSIGTNAFNGCYSLTLYDFTKATSIPTLSNANAFDNTSTSKHIVVPNELYWDWVEATNWSSIASSIQMEYPAIGFKATVANSTIQLNKVGNPTDISLEYMYDGGEWTPYTIGDVLTLENVGDTVWIRKPDANVQIFGNDESNYHQFSMTGQISAEGSITFLNTRYSSSITLNSNRAYCYYKLFSGCSALVKAPILSISSEANATSAFAYMFEGCTGLTELPKKFGELPVEVRSTNLYKGMFKGCTSLETVVLPFTTLVEDSTYTSMGCFDEMFMGCSSLDEITLAYRGNFSTDYFNDWVKNVSATGTLWYNGSDTTVGDYAIPTGWTSSKILYDGFAVEARQANSTVSIVNESSAPTLSLQYSTDEGFTWGTFTVGSTTVTLANVGDRVCFRGTNTKWGGSSNNSRNRFSFTGQVALSGNINSLIDTYNYNTLLNLSSGRDRVFQYLFYGATSLVDAENLVLPATSIGGWTYCNMFEGCSNLTKAPKVLPATTLSSTNWIYSGMFLGCTSLTKSPYIKATSFPGNCCAQMFDGCTSLNEIKLDYTGNFGTSYFNNWVRNVASTGTFYYNGSTTTTGTSYIPSGWTITTFSA